jgi:hypothetical protein
MNGTGTRRQFIPQAARLGSRAAFVVVGAEDAEAAMAAFAKSWRREN